MSRHTHSPPLQRPHALVTGASSGIGRAIARDLARRGYRTTLVSDDDAQLNTIASELESIAPTDAITTNLADAGAIDSLIAQVKARNVGVDVLVNCAGYGIYGPLCRHARSDLERLLNVNFVAPYHLVRAFLPSMITAGRGHILNVCSMSAHMGAWGLAEYSASKGALKSFTQALAAECAGTPVRVTSVFPGIVRTAYFRPEEMRPLWNRVRPHAISPERVARGVMRAIDRPRLEVFVPFYYRVLPMLAAFWPTGAMRMVRSGSLPATSADRQHADSPPLHAHVSPQ